MNLAAPNARLLVLGAGNCNDLDLRALACAYGGVTLLDWDAAALDRGTQAQFPQDPQPCQLLGGVEITGFLPQLHAAKAATRATLIAGFLRGELAPILLPTGRYDVVASCCLLSQLIDSAGSVTPPALLPALAARLRQQHLAMMRDLLAPGGTALLVTDFASSDTAPALLQIPTGASLNRLAQQLLQSGNFFTGLHPGHLARDLAAISPNPASVTISEPWLWTVGNRRFLVIAAQA